MDELLYLKLQGKEAYLKAINLLKIKDYIQAEFHLKAACNFYGKILQLILDNEKSKFKEYKLLEDYSILKANSFLNLSIINFKVSQLGNDEQIRLHALKASYQCSNTTLLLCNHPGLLLEDIGTEHSIHINVEVLKPILHSRSHIVAKALFRRGMAQWKLSDCSLVNVREDFLEAISLSPQNSEIMEALSCINQLISDSFLQKKAMPLDFDMSNGGLCCNRKGFWSQTIADIRVAIPLEELIEVYAKYIEVLSRRQWNVSFKSNCIRIFHDNAEVFSQILERNIIPHSCTWMLEDLSNNNRKFFIVLYLSKMKYLDNWSPGCEWWSRVFVDDERIDTLTCSVDTNSNQLPVEAVIRSYKEHERFQNLSASEQEKELNYLISIKKQFNLSEKNTREEAVKEDQAYSEIPERIQINELRNEFPGINFSFN